MDFEVLPQANLHPTRGYSHAVAWATCCSIFTTSIDYRPIIAEVRDTFFKEIGHYPASTFVVISSLADPDFLVEIEAVAVIG